MNNKKLSGIAILILILFIGCSGFYGIFNRKTGNEAKVTKQALN